MMIPDYLELSVEVGGRYSSSTSLRPLRKTNSRLDRSGFAGATLGTAPPTFSCPTMRDRSPKEVLVVEDKPLVRIVAADALADRGIMAWEAGDAEEALQTLERHPRIGVVFTDINMPGEMDGLRLAHEVTTIRPDVKIIVTSGARTIESGDLPDHGTFLPKPYATQRLVNIVAAKLDGAHD